MMKTMLNTISAVALLFAGSTMAADQAVYDAALAEAKAAQKAAQAVKGEWRDIGDMLKKADEAAKAGDFDAAVKLANTAKFQGEAGKAQAESQAGVGNPSYMY